MKISMRHKREPGFFRTMTEVFKMYQTEVIGLFFFGLPVSWILGAFLIPEGTKQPAVAIAFIGIYLGLTAFACTLAHSHILSKRNDKMKDLLQETLEKDFEPEELKNTKILIRIGGERKYKVSFISPSIDEEQITASLKKLKEYKWCWETDEKIEYLFQF